MGKGTGDVIASGLSTVNCDQQAAQGKKQACKDALAECMAKATDAEKKACRDGKVDAIMKGAGDVIASGLSNVHCDQQAPHGEKQACKDALAECMAKATDAEKKACWDGKVDAIMKGAVNIAATASTTITFVFGLVSMMAF